MDARGSCKIITRLGENLSQKRFLMLEKNFGDKIELWTGSMGDDLITGVVIIKYENTIEYFTPVTEEKYRDSQALSALICNLIEVFHGRF